MKAYKQIIEDVYSKQDLDVPPILICDSPISCNFLHKSLLIYLTSKLINISDINMHPEFRDSNEPLYISTIMKRSQDSKLMPTTYEKVREHVFSILEKEQEWDFVKENTKQDVLEKRWMNIFNSNTSMTLFASNFLFNYIYIGIDDILYGIYTTEFCILCRSPHHIYKSDNGDLHSDTGTAIGFDDGFGLYYFNGVEFDKELYEQIFLEQSITPLQILNIKNIEHRACAMQFYGYDKFIDQLKGIKLDEWNGMSSVTNNPVKCELFEIALDPLKTFRFVKVEDHSVHKITTIGVPITPQTETVMGAIARTFGMTEEEYKLSIES